MKSTTMSRASLILSLLLVATAESRILPGMTSFEKELSFGEKQIILARPFVTENESFAYAVCLPLLKTFDEKHCNVSIETPAFANATYKDTCGLIISPDNPKLETASKLELYTFGDDRLLFSWLIRDRDYRPKTSRVRILTMSTCSSVDVPIPSDEIAYLAPYKNTFDVVIFNQTHCNATSCRQTYSSEGKKLADSWPIVLPGYNYTSHQLLAPRLSDKSLFAKFDLGSDDLFERVFRISADGRASEISSYLKAVGRASFSEAHNQFGVCVVTGSSSVNCRQYDAKVNIKMNANFKYQDDPVGGTREYVRWLQPHNLQDGGMLIVSGAASGPEANRFDEFSVTMLREDGARERPLVVGGLSLECTRIQSLLVAVSESNADELCFHFACKRHVFDRDAIANGIKLVTKCMPRAYLAMPKRRASIVSY